MGKTVDNLNAAFAGESQANRKYLFFAEKAASEGLPQIAKLFRAAADAETVHARNHLNVLKGIETTTQNLKTAINGEFHEMTEMYPDFIAQAKEDKDSDAENSFRLANQVEKIHHSLYHQALKNMEASTSLENKPYYVCQVCGFTIEGEAPGKCPICGALKIQFKEIN